MNYSPKKINIDPLNVKLFMERYHNSENLTRFVNLLVEKYFDGRIIELNEENHQLIKRLKEQTEKSNEFTANLCLSCADFVILNNVKPKIVINESYIGIIEHTKENKKNI